MRILNELTEDQRIVLVDRSKLLTILERLTGNALKFTNTGFVEIGCKIVGAKVLFHVKDSGIGIEKELIHKIFERFSQADGTYSRQYEGLGLGLSIACGHIKLLGGEISVESMPGYGSVFCFDIPYRPFIETDSATDDNFKKFLNNSKREMQESNDKAAGFLFL